MFHTAQINSCDLFVPNPAQHFLGIGNTGGCESFGVGNTSSGKDVSQRTGSEDLFSPATQLHFSEVNENHTSFQKYIAQKPLFGKSGKYFTKPGGQQGFGSRENDDTESSYHVKMDSEKNVVSLINGLSEKVSGLYTTVASLSTEIKLVRGLVENQIKRNDDQITSGQRNAETVHELLEKFEAFFHSYQEHVKVISENSEIVKGGLKSIKEDALKTSESINRNQVSMEIKLLEAVGSVKSILRQETEHQVKQICSQLLLEIEKKCNEKMEDLKQLVQLSLQSKKSLDHEKPETKVLSSSSLNSTSENCGRVRCFHSSAKTTFDRRSTCVRTTDCSNSSVPVMSLQHSLQTSSTVTVQPATHQTAKENEFRDKENDNTEACDTRKPNGKINSRIARRLRHAPPKRNQGRNCSSSFIQFNQVILPGAPKCLKPSSPAVCCSSSFQGCSSSRSQNTGTEQHCASALSSQSSAVSISQLPFTNKALRAAFASVPTMSTVRAGASAANNQNYQTISSLEDNIWM